MADIISTKAAAKQLGMTGRELGAFVKAYPKFAPQRLEGFPPFYSAGLVERIKAYRAGVAAGTICAACGHALGDSGGPVQP